MKKKYDLAIVGGGIAGLVTAELFSRSGYSVILVEKNKKLISGASSEQHGWFHLGSLYTTSHQPIYLKKLVRTIETLQKYYSSFKSMNITVDSGLLKVKPFENGWFDSRPLEYYVVARNSSDILSGNENFLKKIYKRIKWDLKCKLMVSRHERIYRHYWGGDKLAENWIPKANLTDYKKRNIKKINTKDLKINRDTHFLINSFDIPMNTYKITTDIFKSYLDNGGDISLNNKVESINEVVKDGKILKILKVGKEELFAEKVVISAGSGTQQLCKSSCTLQTVASPLIVTYPSLHNKSFVRVTPSNRSTINHIVHYLGDKSYSVIGGGQYAKKDGEESIDDVVNTLFNNTKNTFNNFYNVKRKEHYIGLKTEVLQNKDERNYGSFIKKVEENVYAIIPGKFSLSFNLAVDVFNLLDDKRKRIRKSKNNFNHKSVDDIVAKAKHNIIAEKFINE